MPVIGQTARRRLARGLIGRNARVHGTTGEVPAARLFVERQELQQLPPPYGGGSPREGRTRRASPPAIAYQHPLSVYEDLFVGGLA